MTFDLAGFGKNVRHLYAQKLTADSTDVVVGNGEITLAGQSFTGDECGLEGKANIKALKVRNGKVSTELQASEVLILDVKA